MSEQHQQRDYNEIQGARPCIFRGPLELDIFHKPESACCKARDIVKGYGFYCSEVNKTLKPNACWSCTKRKA